MWLVIGSRRARLRVRILYGSLTVDTGSSPSRESFVSERGDPSCCSEARPALRASDCVAGRACVSFPGVAPSKVRREVATYHNRAGIDRRTLRGSSRGSGAALASLCAHPTARKHLLIKRDIVARHAFGQEMTLEFPAHPGKADLLDLARQWLALAAEAKHEAP